MKIDRRLVKWLLVVGGIGSVALNVFLIINLWLVISTPFYDFILHRLTTARVCVSIQKGWGAMYFGPYQENQEKFFAENCVDNESDMSVINPLWLEVFYKVFPSPLTTE